MPHLFGPPGCGKSSAIDDLAKLVDKQVHVINVSRISPLEIEGVQMPIEDNTKLHMLTATFWTQLKEGDILLMDEFLRGFPEVYNGLLDIFTSRRVGNYVLPNVFIIGASNSTATYDAALEDRLLHLPVPDIRKGKAGSIRIAKRIVDTLGLYPGIVNQLEMTEMIHQEISPMYNMLDRLGKNVSAGVLNTDGHSIRNLIGQVQLREVQSITMLDVINANNKMAMNDGKPQFVILLSGKHVSPTYKEAALRIKDNPKLTPIQLMNLKMNLQLIDMEEARQKQDKEEDNNDDLFVEAA